MVRYRLLSLEVQPNGKHGTMNEHIRQQIDECRRLIEQSRTLMIIGHAQVVMSQTALAKTQQVLARLSRTPPEMATRPRRGGKILKPNRRALG
jgi:hypothetical protein